MELILKKNAISLLNAGLLKAAFLSFLGREMLNEGITCKWKIGGNVGRRGCDLFYTYCFGICLPVPIIILFPHTYIKMPFKCALCLHIREFLSNCYWVPLLIVTAHLALSIFTSTPVSRLSCCTIYTIFYLLFVSCLMQQSPNKPELRLARTIVGNLQHSISNWNCYYYSVSSSSSS